MSVSSSASFALTDEEVATITRFQRSLRDVGVQVRLMEQYIGSMPLDGEQAEQLIRAYVKDVGNTDAFDMQKAGVSFYELVDHARVSELFPEDFLPSQETVDKCVNGFWQALRVESV